MSIRIRPQTPHVCTPAYFGPRSGIRCQGCNTPVEPDPRVSATAASPAPNLEATLAAVNARGGRCERCGHWTFRNAFPPGPGRPAYVGLCRNCESLEAPAGRMVVHHPPMQAVPRRGLLLLRQRDGGRS